jgi:type III restriction enzyme
VSNYEVPEPILNSPFVVPEWHWRIQQGEEPEKLIGRRKSFYYYLDPKSTSQAESGAPAGTKIELLLVNLIRDRVEVWRDQGYPGVSRVTLELLQWWWREGRQNRLFFAQLEAAETVIFLTEGRADLLQGISTHIPWDEPGEEGRKIGNSAFRRYACKMATGAGKTTVMGMLTAWSILNKVANRADSRFSEVVLIVCPNVTIRDRLTELLPDQGEASLYRKRDLVPSHLMPQLTQGKVIVTNWHVFELRSAQMGGTRAKVIKSGRMEFTSEVVHIGAKNTTARGSRYLTLETLESQLSTGALIQQREPERDKDGNIKKVWVAVERYVESDKKWLQRILGRDLGGKKNILVLNDEAHHAYRIPREEPDPDLLDNDEEEEEENQRKEATIWVDGLDRIQKNRGIQLCVDFSATPYYLSRIGKDAGRPFPWVISDFSLIDAIESGLVKIPQLAVRDNTGSQIPGYFNIWNWVLPQLSGAERGASRAAPKPEAILKYAFTPIAMLAGLWEKEWQEWTAQGEMRPPVFIIVCKNTSLSKVIYEWMGENKCPVGIPPLRIAGLKNTKENAYTIRVDTKVVSETDSENSRDDDKRWMRFTLDTVGRLEWPTDWQGRPLLPEGFEDLAIKMGRPLHPPGRDVRCIISVGMLTEGWDCNTVTHVIGLRPFMSQLLCEQVVGRGLRRASYETGENGLLSEETAKVFGVPFEIIPFKANQQGPITPKPKRYHVHSLPFRADKEIRFPRVEGFTQAIGNRIRIDWDKVAPLDLDPLQIPSIVDLKGLAVAEGGRQSLYGPGKTERVDLNPYRKALREQELLFDLVVSWMNDLQQRGFGLIHPQRLFPQLLREAKRFLDEKVIVKHGTERKDVFCAPYFGHALERLSAAVRADSEVENLHELPRYEKNRTSGTTADIDFWTSKDAYEVENSHLNFVVADTLRWEQSAAFRIDRHPKVFSFVKNAGLGFAVPYLHGGMVHDYVPDFLVRFKNKPNYTLILETKGFDSLKDVKVAAAKRWVDAVSAEGSFGSWEFALADHPDSVDQILNEVAKFVSIAA